MSAAPERHPSRILIVLPCCIGDVVLATATLQALRRAYPQAHITWAVGSWSRGVLEGHPMLNALLDTGPAALPVRTPRGFMRMLRALSLGRFDMAVSLVRSPLMSVVMRLSGIPYTVGLDSAGRGFAYHLRAPIDPQEARHEAEIYLDTVRALGIDTQDCYATVPLQPKARRRIAELLPQRGIHGPYLVFNPAGGRNPGMMMDQKRWPTSNFAQLADALAQQLQAVPIIVGGPGDSELINEMRAMMQQRAQVFIGELSFAEIAALAAGAVLYVGNDTGLTHLAAAADAPTIMILGPSDPQRYAPYARRSRALWREAALAPGGVAYSRQTDWDWRRDGISVDEVLSGCLAFLAELNSSAPSAG